MSIYHDSSLAPSAHLALRIRVLRGRSCQGITTLALGAIMGLLAILVGLRQSLRTPAWPLSSVSAATMLASRAVAV